MITGSCLCGAVKFEAVKCAADIYKCHCSRCRKSFGGACSAATFVSAEDFAWMQGEDNLARYQLDAGYTKQFCRTCGSSVPQLVPSHGLYWVPAGLFDDDPGVPLGRHVFVESKAAWEVLDNEVERLPEGFDF